MPTEEDLRIAFRDMERFTPDAAEVLRAVYDQPRWPARPRRLPPHRPIRPVLRAGLALGAAGAVAVAAVITAVAHGPATKATPITAPALRTRLLAAIDTASGDILYAHGGPAPGGGTWQSPAYPQPGQEVHFRILGLGPDGMVFKDGEYSFRMPAGNDATNSYASNFDQGGLQLSGTLMVVNHFRHAWGVWHGHFILGFPLDAAGVRAEIANGQFKVAGRTELHGQPAVELDINVPPNNEAPPHVTAARLWVDATTYLPMRQYLRMSNGQQNVTDYTYLPPTPGNLAKLRPEIPAGYTHVSGSSADLFSRKPKMASK
jgi:hypothetical protein